jgi:hypothetical protein
MSGVLKKLEIVHGSPGCFHERITVGVGREENDAAVGGDGAMPFLIPTAYVRLSG